MLQSAACEKCRLHHCDRDVYTGSDSLILITYNIPRHRRLIGFGGFWEANVKSVFLFFRNYLTVWVGFALALDLILVTVGGAQSPVTQAQQTYNACLAAGIKKTVVF